MSFGIGISLVNARSVRDSVTDTPSCVSVSQDCSSGCGLQLLLGSHLLWIRGNPTPINENVPSSRFRQGAINDSPVGIVNPFQIRTVILHKAFCQRMHVISLPVLKIPLQKHSTALYNSRRGGIPPKLVPSQPGKLNS